MCLGGPRVRIPLVNVVVLLKLSLRLILRLAQVMHHLVLNDTWPPIAVIRVDLNFVRHRLCTGLIFQ
jgi:hypothetical protein